MIALGCMRLSTDPDRDPVRAAAVIAAAVAAGVELLDTADAYCLDDGECGHNERLVRTALADVTGVTVVTKGGLVRPGGAWVTDGRARHLEAAARASRDRLGVAAIDLYLLHAIDPKTSLATSVRALARIREAGIARAIGLSNVNPTQLAEALAIAPPIEAVEVELAPWKLDAIRGGLVAMCADRGIRVLAHRPLGGPAGVRRAGRDPVVAAIARRHSATPAEVVLAWLRSLSPAIATLPGATRVESVESAIRGQRLALDDDARAELAAHFLAVRAKTSPRTGAEGATQHHDRAANPAHSGGERAANPAHSGGERPANAAHERSVDAAHERPANAAPGAPPEVVVILGMPASGKSTLAADYVGRGYTRLNRDERGGSLLDLARALDAVLAEGAERVVVDNTYPTRASRAPVIEVARRHGATVRCVVVATPIEVAQAFAAARVLDRGGFDSKGEIRPGVQFRWRRELEPPQLAEGFTAIEEVVPERRAHGTRAGLVVELDGIVWKARPERAAAIQPLSGALAALAAWSEHVVAATLWRPGLAPAQVAELATRLGELAGRAIDVRYCPHLAGPPVCWCRKPMPGLGLAIARDHDLDPTRTIHIGRGPADRGFALRAGMRYAAISDGWPRPAQET